MAQKIIKTLVDDVTGEESDEITTHTILVDGAGVEIDLTPSNYDELLELLSPYLHAQGARRVRAGSNGVRARSRGASKAKGDSQAIREWAKENGFEVSDRGRVPAQLREAYERAH